MRKKLRRWWPDIRAHVAALAAVPMPLRLMLLKGAGHRFDPEARIRPGTLMLGSKLSLGRDTFVNGGCLIDATAEITVGDEVHIAHRVTILTANHPIGESKRRAGEMTAEPVHIGDGAWIGATAVLLPGVSVGAGCIVAAGAVVTTDLPADGLYAGVPAKLVRPL